ncbi:MAG: asparagine synthase (glutamine-hydrolyzing) [Steroidobacteraceae bacterium]
MCGIAGLIGTRGISSLRAPEAVERMLEALTHRGPDDGGIHAGQGYTLGMRRLAIVDVAHGQQPMATHDDRLVLVYNGETYNHEALRVRLKHSGALFRTLCDTEVVLQQLATHGASGLRDLEGMFALAAWDARAQEMILARDWLGQKSLYWTECEFGFAFASEIKALLTLPGVERRLDLQALSHYMSFRYLPGESTLFEGIKKLPPGHIMRVSREGRRLEKLWRPSYEPKHSLDEPGLIGELDDLMSRVVQEHLMSEVPLGAFLSGGIDSSLIVRYASRATAKPLETFAIGVHEEGQSELPWARQIAAACGTVHHEHTVAPDLAVLTPRMVATLEEPVDPFGAGVYVVSQVAREHVTVALGGDGGDELFAGYDRYQGQRLAQLYSSVPRGVRHGLLRPILHRIPDSFGYKSLAAKLRWLDSMADQSGFDRFVLSLSHLRFTHAAKLDLFTGRASEALVADSAELLRGIFEDGSASHFLDRMLHVDCQTRLSENQLPIVDRMSMAHSLELRSPFLDRRIAEFAMRLPTAMKIGKGRLKYITRELAAKHYGPQIAYRPKQGFGFPLALWLRGPLQGLMRALLEESRFVGAGLFRRDALSLMVDEHLSGQVDHNFRLWMWFNLEVFWRTWLDGEPVDVTEDWIREKQAG